MTSGEGLLYGGKCRRPLRKGDYFFMLTSQMGRFAVSRQLELVERY